MVCGGRTLTPLQGKPRGLTCASNKKADAPVSNEPQPNFEPQRSMGVGASKDISFGEEEVNDLTTHDTAWPEKLGLVIDLIPVDAMLVSFLVKEWNTAGYGAPLSDQDAYGAEPLGTFQTAFIPF